MKIYLLKDETWKQYEGTKKELQRELDKRNIYVSDSAEIGNSAKIGYFAKIGYSAKIGYYAKIGDSAEILVTPEHFSELNILLQTGIKMEKGIGVFYKCVRDDLIDFYTGKHQYVVGKGSRMNLEKDQNIDCGEGYHFMDFWGAVRFLDRRKGKIISAKIKLKDILSVHTKVRCRAYSDVKIVDTYGMV